MGSATAINLNTSPKCMCRR